MKKISLYSAICLLILGIYSVSVFSQTSGSRAPATCRGGISFKEPGGETLHNSCLNFNPENECKEESYTMSLDSYQQELFDYMKRFEEYDGLPEAYESAGIPMPEVRVEYDSDNRFRIRAKNFPACMDIFNVNGGKLPGNNTSDVYIPYMRIKADVYNRCKNNNGLIEDVSCFFKNVSVKTGNTLDSIFTRNEIKDFLNGQFDPKAYMQKCMTKTLEKSRRLLNRGKDEKAAGLITNEAVVKFDNYRYNDQTLVTSETLDKVGKACVKDLESNKLLELQSKEYTGQAHTNRSLYFGCNTGNERFLPGVDEDLLSSLEAISLKLNEGNKIVDYPGSTGNDYSLPISKKSLENLKCEPQNLENESLRDLLGSSDNSDGKFQDFLNSLTKNANTMHTKLIKAKNLQSEKKFDESEQVMISLQNSLQNEEGNKIYDLPLIYNLARKLNTNNETLGMADELFKNYKTIKMIKELNRKNPNDDRSIKEQLAKETVNFKVCRAAANMSGIVEKDDCKVSGAKTKIILAYLKDFKKNLSENSEEVKNDVDLSEYEVAASSSVETQANVKSIVQVPYPVNPDKNDLDATIKLLENRKAYVDNYINGLSEEGKTEHINRCEKGYADYKADSDPELVTFLEGIQKGYKDKEEDTEVADKDKDSDNQELMDMMKWMMMSQAQGNSGANGFYNPLGVAQNNNYVMQAISGFSNQMFNMAYNNYQMHGLFLDRYNSMSNNMMNYQFGMSNYMLQNNSLSNMFIQNTLSSNPFMNFGTYQPPLATPTYFNSRAPASFNFLGN